MPHQSAVCKLSRKMNEKLKILVAGDVRGRFKQLFQRVETINKKTGPFEILLCVGDFFGNEAQNDELIAYKNGFKHISVPTYILGPNSKEHVKYYKDIDDGEICSNLSYLGKRGLYTLSSGVKIAYLSGVESNAAAAEDYNFSKEDVIAVRNSCLVNKSNASEYRGIDILLTSQWPYGITEDANDNASKYISFLCREIKPRYHFCGLRGKYFESPPFRILPDEVTPLSLSMRFLSLADVGNAEKSKYIYALSLSPVEKTRILELVQKTTDEVPCPYNGLELGLNAFKNESSESRQYFYDMESRDRKRHGGDKQHRRTKIMHIDQEKCWFCLSSPDVDKHLIITIGDNFYLALAKGPINNYHVLIMSTTHISAAALLTEDDWQELTKFKNALRKFFKSKGQVVCFTERHYKTSHLQLNALGIDEGYAWKIKHSFEDKAEEFNLQFETLPPLTASQMLPQQGPYFVAELPDETTLITRQMKNFPLHYARDVFCSENLLNCDEKVNWKECLLDKEEELALVETFRTQFAPFDFTDD